MSSQWANLFGDSAIDDLVGRGDVFHGGIGEYNAESECIIGLISLITRTRRLGSARFNSPAK